MEISALEKPAGQPCAHECSRGCRIYERRPQECREFACQWLLGGLPKHARPDKLGAVVVNDAEVGLYVAAKTREAADATVALLKSLGVDGRQITLWEAPRAEHPGRHLRHPSRAPAHALGRS